MDKIVACIFIIMGVIMLLSLVGADFLDVIEAWLIMLGFIVIGILKLLTK
jgi:purine-cytosine permease-like protein